MPSAISTGSRRVVIVADDLTGACDAGAAFAAAGFSVTVARGDVAQRDGVTAESQVIAWSANARDVDIALAAGRFGAIHAALGDLGASTTFIKIDSTLRGHLEVALRLAMTTWDPEVTIVAPAFPAQGRTVVDGNLHISGDSETHTEPVRPRFGRVADGARFVDLDEIRTGAIDGLIAHANGEILLCDAEEASDLETIVAATRASGRRALWVGSAGLAHAIARFLPTDTSASPRPARPASQSVRLVVGTMSSQARTQVAALEASENVAVVTIDSTTLASGVGSPLIDEAVEIATSAGRDLCFVVTGPPHLDRREAIQHGLARLATTEIGPGTGLVLTGGATAEAVLEHLAIGELVLDGEVTAGVPIGHASSAGLSIVTKAGAFGGPDALIRCRAALRGAPIDEGPMP